MSQKKRLLQFLFFHCFIFSNIDGVFMCLGSLLKLNHLLIEPLLPDIWSLLVRLPKQLVENGKVRELGGGTEGKF